MRVLSVIHHTEFSGPTNRNIRIYPHLKKRGVDLLALVPDRPKGSAYRRLKEGGIDVVQTRFHRLRDVRRLDLHIRFLASFFPDVARIRQVIRDRDIDIVQVNGFMNPHGAIAAKLEHKKVVWQMIDTQAPRPLMWALMPLVAALADAVMSTGKKTAEAHPMIRLVEDRLFYFCPPVDIDRFTFDPAVCRRARQALGLLPDDIVVGTVGTLNPFKGHRFFIDAAAELVKGMPAAKFVVLGSVLDTRREYARNLRGYAARQGFSVGRNMIFRDPEAAAHFWGQALDVFWLTSLPRSEGIPTAVEEAMALGIPVVSFDVGSVSEIVDHGRTGYVAPVFDVFRVATYTRNLIEDPALRAKMGDAAQKKARWNFSARQCAMRHDQCYRYVSR
jgi:glycosyltransferase involved in cell wall biosynthesis